MPPAVPVILFAALALAACDPAAGLNPAEGRAIGDTETNTGYPDVGATRDSDGLRDDAAYPGPGNGLPEAYPGGSRDSDSYPGPDGGAAGGPRDRHSPFDGLRIDPTVRHFPIVVRAPQPPLERLLTPAAGIAAPGSAGAACAGIVGSDGDRLVLDSVPFVFFGINVHFLMDKEFPESRMEPTVRDLGARGVGVIRVWFFHDEDPERFERLLDIGQRHGVRFIVTLVDNVFKGRDWFGGDEDKKHFRPHLERTVSRFKDRPEILFWELANEPNCAGDFDAECLDTIKDWLSGRSITVRAIDACHLVSTGMISAGNHDFEHDEYRSIHGRDTIGVVSAHRRVDESREREIEIADDLGKPIIYGEIYDKAHDDNCQPLDGGSELKPRAERVKDDLRKALRDGVDGYVLWAFAAGGVERPNGTMKYYCGSTDYEMSDPVWQRIADDPDLPPPIPWRQ